MFAYASNAFALKCIIYRGTKTRPEPDQLYTFRNNLIVYYYMVYIVICVYLYGFNFFFLSKSFIFLLLLFFSVRITTNVHRSKIVLKVRLTAVSLAHVL